MKIITRLHLAVFNCNNLDHIHEVAPVAHVPMKFRTYKHFWVKLIQTCLSNISRLTTLAACPAHLLAVD